MGQVSERLRETLRAGKNILAHESCTMYTCPTGCQADSLFFHIILQKKDFDRKCGDEFGEKKWRPRLDSNQRPSD